MGLRSLSRYAQYLWLAVPLFGLVELGASVYFSSSPLQRLQRDVEVLKGHVIFDWDRTAELAGRFALGFGLRPTDMV